MMSTMQEVIVSYAAKWVQLVPHEQKNKKLLKYIRININCRTNFILNCHSTNHLSRYWQCHLINKRKIHLHMYCSSNSLVVKLTTLLRTMPRLRLSRALPLLPLYAFMSRIRKTLPFVLYRLSVKPIKYDRKWKVITRWDIVSKIWYKKTFN